MDALSRPQTFQMNTARRKTAPVRTVAAISSAIGTGVALAGICKKQGYSLRAIKSTPLKDWAIFKIHKRGKHTGKAPLQIEEKEILTLAGGSIAGGLTGGYLVDKKNMKAKLREALTQMAGNVALPVFFVGASSRLYKKFESQIKSVMPMVKTNGKKHLKLLNKFSRSLPAVVLTGISLASGIVSGNKVTNLINDKFLGQKQNRKIKTTDFAPHVDDLCLAITLMGSKNSPLASSITRSIPLFLTVPGYQSAKAQDSFKTSAK